MGSRTAAQKLKQIVKLGCLGSITFAGICVYKGDEKFYGRFLMPFLQNWVVKDAEQAHRLAIWAAKNNFLIAPASVRSQNKTKEINPVLSTSVFGIKFRNPVGTAAGFDKNAEAVEGIHNLGFGFVEIGSVTPRPQTGNPKPRVFRLNEDKAIINRYGFNSEGHDIVYKRLESLKKKLYDKSFYDLPNTNHETNYPVIGVNLGKNKDSPLDSVQDFVDGIRKFGTIADYLVINISSPNTIGLRSLQGREYLRNLIREATTARNQLIGPQDSNRPPILIKLAPDLTDEEKSDIANVVMASDVRIDGLIISNTTISRPNTLKSPCKSETGGLSGSPVKDLATQTIFDMYKLTKGEIPIIGVGGVSNGQDAYEKIIAGASLIQLYSALVYVGPPIAAKVNVELEQKLKENGFSNIQEAVGSAYRQ